MGLFDDADLIEDYWGLLNYFSRYSSEWYEEHDVYFERHHVYPVCETKKEVDVKVLLPVKYHFLAHLFRAKEYEASGERTLAYKNYSAAAIITGVKRYGRFAKNVALDVDVGLLEEAKKKSIEKFLESGMETRFKKGIVPWNKGKTVLDYGASARKSYKDAQRNRRKPIRETYGEEKANAILLKVRKRVICLDTLEVFESVKAVNETTKSSNASSSVIHARKLRGKFYAFYDESKDESYWKSLLERYKEEKYDRLAAGSKKHARDDKGKFTKR